MTKITQIVMLPLMLTSFVNAEEPAKTTPETKIEAKTEKELLPGARLQVWKGTDRQEDATVKGMSYAAKVDQATSFSEKSILDDEKFKAMHGQNCVMKWQGYIKIEKGGNYNIIVENANIGQTSYIKISCIVIFANKEMFNLKRIELHKGKTNVETKEIELEPGYYPVEISCALDPHSKEDRKNIETLIKIRGENDDEPKIITPQLMFHEKK